MRSVIIYTLRLYINLINFLSSRIGGKHAFFLFCYPFPIKLKPKQQAFLDKSERFKMKFENKEIQGYSWGTGAKVILCLHGWQSHSYRWKKYIETLNHDTYTIISIDAPAHGNSTGKLFNVPMYARLIDQILNEYNVNYILSHSLGGFSAMCLFHEKPNLSPEKFAVLGVPGEANEFIDEFMKILKVHKRVKVNLVDYFKSYAHKDPSYYSALRFAPSQKKGALLIHDTEDVEAPYSYAEKIHSVWPESELYTTTGLGHKLRGVNVVTKVVDYFGN